MCLMQMKYIFKLKVYRKDKIVLITSLDNLKREKTRGFNVK
jgi:hypothetical protein